MQDYILGYGSLIERASRLRTTPSAEIAYPVIAKGYLRGWFARTGDTGLSTTYLGCVQDSEALINGVVYKVSPQELHDTDEREKGYTRIKVPWDAITDLAGELDASATYWIYCNDFPGGIIPEDCLPNENFPVVQSYVDICVNGCIEAETEYPGAKDSEFIKFFIQSTQYWNSSWANDRIYPRRPFMYRKNAYTIDSYLQEFLLNPDLFKQIYIE